MKREKEKIKENEKIEEINNPKKDKNIILIILWIIFFITLGVIIIKFVIPSSNDKYYIEDKKDNIQLSGTVDFPKDIEFEAVEGLGFYCSNEEYYTGTYNYELGTDVYCGISFELSGNKKIKEIYGEFSFNENIEYIGIHDVWEDWNLIQNENKFHLTTDKTTSYTEGFYTLKFKVNKLPEDELINIEFKNLIAKDEDNKYYKFKDDIISLNQTKPIQSTPTNYKYEKDEEKNELVFYKYDEINNNYNEINRYKCQNKECGVINYYKEETLDLNNGKTLIFENKNSNNNTRYEKIILFDFNKGIISEYISNIKSVITIKDWNDINNPIEYYVFRTSDDEMALIDSNGKILKDFYNQKLVLSCYEGCVLQDFSPKNDMIVTIKNGKYGIEKITSNDIVVEHNYDELSLTDAANVSNNENNLYDKRYYRGKINDKWYLYDFETKKEITEGYERLYLIDENTILVKIEDNLYIKDLNGNNITEDSIKIKYGLFPFAPKAPEGIRIFKNNNIITISIVDGNKEQQLEYSTYEYNIETKELTQKEIGQ